MNGYELRKHILFSERDIEISKEDFENFFTKTKETVRFTFNGWDGKSYNGEARNAKVIRTNIAGFEELRLIKVGSHLCYIDEESSILEKETGEYNPAAEWLVDVRRA